MAKEQSNYKIVMDKKEMKDVLSGLINEIYERNKGGRLVILGIKRRGEILAQRAAERLKSKLEVLVGSLDITLYRDDLTSIDKKPIVRRTEIPFPIDGENLLLFDDVLFTGRTIRSALTEIIDFGRPKKVQLAVLIDREERELPICPDFVGKVIKVKKNEMVEVRLREIDEQECVMIIPR